MNDLIYFLYLHIFFGILYEVLDPENFSHMLPQNLVLQNKFYKSLKNLFYQSFDCLKTNFGSFTRESLYHQMLMTQLLEAYQESHSEVSDLAGSLLVLSALP